MELRLNIEGAAPEELARGVAAAEAVFAHAGITALQGAEGLFALEGWDIKGFPEDDQPTEHEDQAASVWMEADEAATAACCAGWPEDKVPRHRHSPNEIAIRGAPGYVAGAQAALSRRRQTAGGHSWPGPPDRFRHCLRSWLGARAANAGSG